MNGYLYFTAENDNYRRELWKSDGTNVGTTIIDIVPGYYGSTPQYLTNVNGTLFFRADGDNGTGAELWKSNGTLAGTVMVKDLIPGNLSSGITNIINANGIAYFMANGDGTYYELYKSDGTSAGTTLIQDLNSGILYNLYSFYIFYANNAVYFDGNNGLTGFELWKVSTVTNPCTSNLVLSSTTDDINNGTILKQARIGNGIITATNKITNSGTNATYQAQQILLNAGFKADYGVTFKAEVGGCN